ncbi:MAG: MBL fold metallo-hydrolase [Pseudomonadota bacterium]
MKHAKITLLSLIIASVLSQVAIAQVQTEKLAENLYLLGGGSTMVVSVGPDGAFLVDDQVGSVSDQILKTIKVLTDQPLKFVINTHLHKDHVGGNENMANAGAIVVAHENVRTRMSKEQALDNWPLGDTTVPAYPEAALPIVTFTESMKFHFNGEAINVIKMPNAHTDGDSIVHFPVSNVIHVGDAISTKYPYLDLASGGTLKGSIELAAKVLSLMDSETRIVSGHSPIIGKSEVQAFHDMLTNVQDRIGKLIDEGKSQAEVLATNPLAKFDERWGNAFVSTKLFTRTVYTDMTN